MARTNEVGLQRILDDIRKMLEDINELSIDGEDFIEIKNNINLARTILTKIDTNSSLAIINRFYNYYTSNKKAFLERKCDFLQPELPLTKKISISIGPIIEKTGQQTSAMWKHLTLIFYLISLLKKQPDQKLKDLLSFSETPDSDDETESDEPEEVKEEKVEEPVIAAAGAPVKKPAKKAKKGPEEEIIAQVVESVSSGISGPIDDPMTAITTLMASGGLNKIMATIQGAIKSGRVKPKKMLSSVHGMLDNLTNQLSEDDKE